MNETLTHLWHIGMVAIFALNIGSSYQRTKSARFAGFNRMEEFIWKHDATVAWFTSLVLWVAVLSCQHH